MDVIAGTGAIVAEPDWSLLLSDPLEIDAAGRHWKRIANELRDRDLLASVNGHAIQRLVLAYIVYDRCAREVAETGAVNKPKRGSPRAIARISPYFTAMLDASSAADRQEQELGISPRRRAGAGKVQKRTTRTTGADAFVRRAT